MLQCYADVNDVYCGVNLLGFLFALFTSPSLFSALELESG